MSPLYLGFCEVPEGNLEEESHWLQLDDAIHMLSPPSHFSEMTIAITEPWTAVT